MTGFPMGEEPPQRRLLGPKSPRGGQLEDPTCPGRQGWQEGRDTTGLKRHTCLVANAEEELDPSRPQVKENNPDCLGKKLGAGETY